MNTQATHVMKLTANDYLKSNLLNIIHKSCNTAPLNKKCLCNVFLHSLKCLFRVFTEGSANQANYRVPTGFGKVWKSMEFDLSIFQVWKSMEKIN